MSDGGEGGGGGGKLDRWLSRQRSLQATAAAAAASELGGKDLGDQSNGATSTLDARTPPSADKPPAGAGGRPSRGSMGGVGACCNLIRLLDPEELARVHDVLVDAMREKNVKVPELPSDLVAGSTSTPGRPHAAVPPQPDDNAFQRSPMILMATAGESIAMLTEVLEEARKLGSEAVQHTKKRNAATSGPAAAGLSGAGVASQGAGSGEGLGAEAAGEEKLGRWLKRAIKKDNNGPPPTSAPDASAAPPPLDETPVAFVKRACDSVRASWASGVGRNMSLAEEWEKLRLERASLDALIRMVTAVKETPEKIVTGDGYSPQTPGGGGGMNGAMHTPSPHGAPAAQRSGPKAPYQRPDPDKLLAEFLAARREERTKETAQMIQEKNKPKNLGKESGWRAGSPMASAKEPTVPVRISLSRPPPPPPAPMMLGPPPENLGEGMEGGSREDVINKEGGGFFFYPPGHPNYVPGGPASANIQAIFPLLFPLFFLFFYPPGHPNYVPGGPAYGNKQAKSCKQAKNSD